MPLPQLNSRPSGVWREKQVLIFIKETEIRNIKKINRKREEWKRGIRG